VFTPFHKLPYPYLYGRSVDKTMAFTNSKMHTSFLESTRCAAWSAIKELGERLKWRLHNTQKDLKEEKEDTTALKKTIRQLQSGME
jgi:hypothetical protein